jgi:ABC-type sugar transport system ATPase subunit
MPTISPQTNGVTPEQEDRPVISARGLSKSYGSVRALHDIEFDVRPGEVFGIVGDNGAGKSTVLKILSGLEQADEGTLLIHDEPADMGSPRDARELGIATVYQDLALVEVLDIATNMFLGDFPRRRGMVDRRAMERETVSVMRELGVRVGSVQTQVGRLSGGQRQLVAICRAVRLPNASVLLLDEPTAALGVRETQQVADIILRLKQSGRTIVCVSHDMEFLLQHADRVHVIRLGRSIATRPVAATQRDEIVGLITGSFSGDREARA